MKPIHSCLLLILVSVIVASLPAQACSYDGQFNNPFTESFPGSLDIAIATQNALEGDQLDKVEKLEGKQGLRRASWWLKLMVDQYSYKLESISYIYLVDSHLWSEISPGSQIKVHTSPTSNNPSSVMLLSEAVLYALVHNKVDFERAVQLGVIHY